MLGLCIYFALIKNKTISPPCELVWGTDYIFLNLDNHRCIFLCHVEHACISCLYDWREELTYCLRAVFTRNQSLPQEICLAAEWKFPLLSSKNLSIFCHQTEENYNCFVPDFQNMAILKTYAKIIQQLPKKMSQSLYRNIPRALLKHWATMSSITSRTKGYQ